MDYAIYIIYTLCLDRIQVNRYNIRLDQEDDAHEPSISYIEDVIDD